MSRDLARSSPSAAPARGGAGARPDPARRAAVSRAAPRPRDRFPRPRPRRRGVELAERPESLVVRSSAAGSRFSGEAPDLPALATQLDVDLVLRARCCARATACGSRRSSWRPPRDARPGRTRGVAGRERCSVSRTSSRSGIVASLSRSLGGSAPAERPERPHERARLRVLPARQRGRPRPDEAARGARPLPPVRGGGSRLRAGLGPPRARAPHHRQVPRDPRARHAPGPGGGALRRALELSPRLPLAHKLMAHLESEMGRAQEAMVRLLGLAAETRNDAELFAGLVHACRYCGPARSLARRASRGAAPRSAHLPTGVVHTCGSSASSSARLRDRRRRRVQRRVMALAGLGLREEARRVLAAAAATLRPYSRCSGRARRPARRAAEAPPRVSAASWKRTATPRRSSCTRHAGRASATASEPSTARGSGRAGYHVRQALRGTPGSRRCATRSASGRRRRADADSRLALAAFREAGGEALLGVGGGSG